MVFSSITFLFYFLPIALLLYYVVPLRNPALVAISLLFYAWGEPVYVLALLGSIAGNYGLALAIDGRRDKARRRMLLAGIAANLIFLGAFKYADFALTTLAALGGAFGLTAIAPASPGLGLTLPLGISFFTFHAMSYLIDVYRRDVAAERNPIHVALYFALFPQLIAGPIVRFKTIVADIHRRRHSAELFADGIRYFVVGLGMKVLLANNLAVPADAAFGLPGEQLYAALAWLGLICYGLQIYFDFAGYSLMAIGLGLMFGFHLPVNFNYPYISQSLAEFWRRWHITLSAWFRDYVYIPLGGNRRGRVRTYFNLLAVFLLCGLWHGAAWTFVLWGLWHGAFLALERGAFGRMLARAWRPLRHIYCLVVVFAAWVLFRDDSFARAGDYYRALLGGADGDPRRNPIETYLNAELWLVLVAAFAAATPLPAKAATWLARRLAARGMAGAAIVDGARIVGLLALFVVAAAYLAGGAYNPFIYFRF